MNTIDRLKAFVESHCDTRHRSECLYEVRCDVVNALPALLKVAEAAQKSLDQLSYILEVAHNEQHDEVLYPNMLSECAARREELRKALYELEAQ